MEEESKQLKILVKEMQDLLLKMNTKSWSLAKEKAYETIEDHFSCLKTALEKRKGELIKAVDEAFHQYAEPTKDHISVQVIFNTASELVHQSLSKLELIPQAAANQNNRVIKECKLDFTGSLLQAIHTHGQVLMNDVEVTTCKSREVSTLVGSNQGCLDGKGIVVKMTNPFGIVVNPTDSCLYFCDYGNKLVRKIMQSGEVVKFASVSQPTGICYYAKENCFYVLDCGTHTIKRVSGTGETRVHAGSGQQGYQDGEATQAKFSYPYGVTVNQQTGDVYVGDYYNHVIRKITSQGFVSTLCGIQMKKGYADGNRQSAQLLNPVGVCFSHQYQVLIVCDYANNKLRKVSLNGDATTLCDIEGPRFACELPNGNIFVSSSSHKIFHVPIHEGNVTSKPELLAGSGKLGEKDGLPKESEFHYPNGITVDPKSNICYVADFGNHRIRTFSYE